MQAVVVEGEIPIGVAESSVQFHQGWVCNLVYQRDDQYDHRVSHVNLNKVSWRRAVAELELKVCVVIFLD
jgi:hypothetical protein